MGRPYEDDLRLLSASYAAARAADVTQLVDAVGELRGRPLLVVGSGGSLSACHFAARLHETWARLPARVLTPLEFVRHPPPQAAGVLLLSAGGGNPDILAAATHAIAAEYAPVVGLCTRADTMLGAALARHRHAVIVEYVGPSRNDGFLATNSLVSTATLLARAYDVRLPADLPALGSAPAEAGVLGGGEPATSDNVLASFPRSADTVAALCRPSVIALAGGWATPAATDLESRWSEAGFGTVTVTDARNFAHGRHSGLVRRMADTAVVGIVTGDDATLVERTLGQLPRAAHPTLLRTPLSGEVGALDLLVSVIRLAGAVGQRVGVDPGRPAVPAFGRALYHAGITRRQLAAERAASAPTPDTGAVRPRDTAPVISGHTASSRPATAIDTRMDLWIRRKVSVAVWQGAPALARERWRAACRAWVAGVESASIGGVVFDFDGTLCEVTERFSAPAAAVGDAIARLVNAGLQVGVATGRGDSVLEALRTILPHAVWPVITVGMYNGGVLCQLDESPGIAADEAPEVARARTALQQSLVLAEVARFRVRPAQLTVHSARPLPEGMLHRLVLDALAATVPDLSLQVFSSGHTVDVIAPAVTKLRVVDAVRRSIHAAPRQRGPVAQSAATPATVVPSRLDVMTIGDQGQAGGNDGPLLAHPLGLSVEHASSTMTGCWNVAPTGLRRTAAMLAYLEALRPIGGGVAQWSVARASRSPRAVAVRPAPDTDAATHTNGERA